MPECHKCIHNGKRHSECQTCTGPSETNNHGKVHVSVEKVAAFIPAPDPAQESDARYEKALDLIRALCGVGLIEREIAIARMRGENYPTITTRLNIMLSKRITLQGVHARCKKAVKADSILENLFRGMVVKQRRRAAKGEK